MTEPRALLTLAAADHPADAIQRAAYKYSDRLTIELTRVGDNFECRVFSDQDDPDANLIDEFRREILDQVLRRRIRTETQGIRDVILSLAFSNTGFVEDAG